MALSDLSIPLLRAHFWSREPLPGLAAGTFLEADCGPPQVGFVEPLLRRRLSPLGRGMLHCAWRAAEGMGELRSVFASQHGEPGRTLPILADLAEGLEASPTQFSMGVHNAIAGIWSIARKDRSASTSLAAGAETFGWGLLEAYALHRTHGGAPVLFVYADDRLPDLLAGFEARPEPLHAAAFLLGLPAQRTLWMRRDPEDAASTQASLESLQSLYCFQTLEDTAAPGWSGPSGVWSWRLE